MVVDVTITANVLARYVPALRDSDEDFRLRLVLHDFGMVFQHPTNAERVVLLAEEPDLFDARWDAFLAAYAQYLACHAGLEAPPWVRGPRRYLGGSWFPGRRFPRERSSGGPDPSTHGSERVDAARASSSARGGWLHVAD